MSSVDCLQHSVIASGARLMIGSISDTVPCQPWSNNTSNTWGKSPIMSCFNAGAIASVLCREGNATYDIAKALCIMAAYATSPGIQKQKRAAQSHPGPLHPDH